MLLLSLLSLIAVSWCQQLQVEAQPVELTVPAIEDSEVGRALYDQRQTGKYNIHVSIKDVAIIEVDQNELADDSYNAEDDDYYYDDNALTIKPIKFTTEGSTTSTKQAAAATAASASTVSAVPTTTTTTTTTTSTSTTSQPSTVVVLPVTAPTVAVRSSSRSNSSNNSSRISSYSPQLLVDIAATQHQKPKTNNLIIMDSSSTTSLPHWLQARSKHEPITTTTTTAVPTVLRPGLTDNIEYTPPQGHNSPIFKVKVQRAANENPTEHPAQCRAHQYRDSHGKCRTKRSGSVLRKLFSMLVSLPFAGHRRAGHGLGHGLQVSP